MSNFLIIGISITAGILVRKWKLLPSNTHLGINLWIIYMAMPAVSFKYLPHITWSNDLILPIVAPIIVWWTSWLYAQFYAKSASLNKKTKGAFKMATGMSNTSFLGFPLVLAYFGEDYLSTAVICDAMTFVVLSTFGITAAIRSAGKEDLSAGKLIKRVVTFPPFLGSVGALTIPHYVNIDSLSPLFDNLAVTIAPLALFSIGLQLTFNNWQSELKNISAGLLYKLILAPLIVLLIAVAFNINSNIAQVTVFEMAMPSLITAGIIANKYKLNIKLSNLTIGIGIIISFASTAIWFQVINYFL